MVSEPPFVLTPGLTNVPALTSFSFLPQINGELNQMPEGKKSLDMAQATDATR